ACMYAGLFLRFGDENFHPAVAGAVGFAIVGSDRLVGAAPVDGEAVHRHAAAGQIVAGAGGAVDRERVGDGVGAGAVGMADHGDQGGRVLVQAAGEFIQDRAEVRLDVGAADVERDVAGNVELEPVVLGLADLDAGALGGLFHLAFLLFHAAGPNVADD